MIKTTKKNYKKLLIATAVTGLMASGSAHAANWLMLQGTEPDHSAPMAKVWGFVQVDYQRTDDTKLPNGNRAAFNQMQPDQQSSDSFNIKRARIGVRGANFPLDPNINYFLLAELGNNGITTGKGASAGQLTDASVTFNHIKGARVRAGLFKTPGSEEGLRSAVVGDYVNFTNATDRLLQERYFEYEKGNTYRNGSVGAFRDIGLQVFDSFAFSKDWEASYALMYGNGNGISMGDNNKHKDLYGYVSVEKYFGADRGPRSQSMKFYGWTQNGKRTFYEGAEAGASKVKGEKERTRSGLGTTYFDGKYRLAAEYIMADGMIFAGTSGGAIPADGATFSVQTDQKADGYYLDLGYRVISNLELNVRYDYLDSGTKNDAATGKNADVQRQFTTTTLGAQYFFNKKTSVRVNYEFRDIKAPGAPSNAPVHNIVNKIDDRLSFQVTMAY